MSLGLDHPAAPHDPAEGQRKASPRMSELPTDSEVPSWLPDPPGGAEGGEESFSPSPGEEGASSPPAASYVSRADYERLQNELEEERGRSRESRAWADDAQQRFLVESSVRQELERLYRQHSEASQQQAHTQPPQPEAIDDWLVDPQGIASYVNRYGSWMRETLLHQLSPFLQRLAWFDGILPTVLSRAAEDSISQARRSLEAEGVTDFDELRGEIEQAFGANPAGARLILDPGTVASVYHYLSRQRKVQPVRSAAKAVPSAGTSHSSSRTTPPALSAAAREIASRLQVDPAKLARRLAARRTA